MTYKIVFFDVDGTLKNTQSQIPASTKRAVAALQQNGVLTVIATGRPIYEAKAIMEELGIENIVGANGGQVLIQNEHITNLIVGQDVVADIIHQATQRGESVTVLGTTGAHHTNKEHPVFKEFVERFGFAEVRKGNNPLSETGDALLLTAYLENDESVKAFSFAKEQVHMVTWRGHLQSGTYIDFYPLKQSKAVGIEAILNRLGLSSNEAVAFGDGLNDLEMLQYVGMGIAMGNAEEGLKAIANKVTAHVDDDGIEKALVHLGLVKAVEEDE